MSPNEKLLLEASMFIAVGIFVLLVVLTLIALLLLKLIQLAFRRKGDSIEVSFSDLTGIAPSNESASP